MSTKDSFTHCPPIVLLTSGEAFSDGGSALGFFWRRRAPNPTRAKPLISAVIGNYWELIFNRYELHSGLGIARESFGVRSQLGHDYSQNNFPPAMPHSTGPNRTNSRFIFTSLIIPRFQHFNYCSASLYICAWHLKISYPCLSVTNHIPVHRPSVVENRSATSPNKPSTIHRLRLLRRGLFSAKI